MRLIYEMRILQISQLISTIDDGQNPQGCHCSEKKPPPAVDEEEDCGITLSTRYTDDADDKPSSKDSEKARHIARLSILLFCKTDDMFHGPVYTEDMQAEGRSQESIPATKQSPRIRRR